MTPRNFGRPRRMYEPPPRRSLWRSLLSAAAEGLALIFLMIGAYCLALLLYAMFGTV